MSTILSTGRVFFDLSSRLTPAGGEIKSFHFVFHHLFFPEFFQFPIIPLLSRYSHNHLNIFPGPASQLNEAVDFAQILLPP